MTANVQIGPGTEFLTSGREYLHSRHEGHVMKKTVVISSVARYNGGYVLPKGLAMGKISASGKFMQHENSATDGTEDFRGFLDEELELRDAEGAVQDTPAVIVVFGRVKETNVFFDTTGDVTAAKTDAANGDNGCFFIWD